MSRTPSREEALFADALARPPERRVHFLAEACGTDAALLARLVGLIAAHDGPESLTPPLASGAGVSAIGVATVEEKPGNLIDRYKLLQKIGEGGCGVVWMAEQEEPVRRRVALKVIKLGMDTKAVIARFEAERQALAMMDHPNIARVLDAGATDAGRPFFVMELVRGIPITKYCDENQLTPASRLELFIKVCQAIQHAHQKGVIHRDIKPSNILVTVNDGQPSPKVIDFGIAKATQGPLTDATMFTAFEQFIGTPVYMSPEQAEMSSLDIDTRSDIYSLGILLYELLTGLPPFDPKEFARAGVAEIRHHIRTDEPLRPSARLRTMGESERTTLARQRGTAPAQLSILLRGDLDWIVMRCIEKDRTRRYDTVNGLAMDIQRHLRHEPVVARPPSSLYLLQKLIRRHRVGFAATGIVVGVVVIGAILIAAQATRALRAERLQNVLRDTAQKAQASEAEARRTAQKEQQRNVMIRWARDTALPEINRLIQKDDFAAAFGLARQVEEHLPDDPALAAIWPTISSTLTIDTIPPGAEIYIKPYHSPESAWEYMGKSPLTEFRLGRTFYRWQFRRDGYALLERADGWALHDPRDTISREIRLEPLDIHPAGMVRVTGGKPDSGPIPRPAVPLDDFLIDRYEVTNREFKAFVDTGGYATQKFWRHPFVRDGKSLTWGEGMGMFRDRTGQPGPATWRQGTFVEGEGDHPVTGISWFEAAAYAEFVGKRLPSIHHWRRAAGSATTRSIAAFVVPHSNFNGRGTAAVGQYQGMSSYGAYDMAGNAKEWCWNETGDGRRYILGGAWPGPGYMFNNLDAKPALDRAETNGFRCIKLYGTSTPSPEVDAPVPAASSRNYALEKPVAPEEFDTFRRWFSYDRTDLEGKTESADDRDSRWRKEKISFNAAYDGERMAGYMFLPKSVPPPYQVILFFPGGPPREPHLSAEGALDRMGACGSLIEAGRAVIFPIYKGTYERGPLRGMAADSVSYRDWTVQLAKDVSRTIDYLETRRDVQFDKIAFYGSSWGGRLGVIFTAIESRFKASVLVLGGLPLTKRLPEVDELNFLPHVTVPTLMLNGRYDVTFPLEASQRPRLKWLGSPPENNRHVLYDTGHDVPPNQMKAEILAWLDKYLGPVK